MKKIPFAVIVLGLTILMGCGSHEHTWAEATCTSPRTCVECGETEGTALQHEWTEATCTMPRKCTVCKITKGEPLGHMLSSTACEEDRVCARCGETFPAPGHQYVEATCTKESYCSVCGATQGEALGHDIQNGVCTRCGLESYETIEGRGDDVVSDVAVGNGIYRMHVTHAGRSNFALWAYDAEDDRDLLINEIGKYDGYVLLNGSAPYMFEIKADGVWTYTIERLPQTEKTTFSGRGDAVTDIFEADTGVWAFTHDGSSNFAVRGYTTGGRDLLVNEIGPYSGKVRMEIPEGSNAFFEITADGNWTAEPVK